MALPLWTALREAEQARRHAPGHALRFWLSGELGFVPAIRRDYGVISVGGFTASIAWRTFDTQAGVARGLFALRKDVARD